MLNSLFSLMRHYIIFHDFPRIKTNAFQELVCINHGSIISRHVQNAPAWAEEYIPWPIIDFFLEKAVEVLKKIEKKFQKLYI